MNRISFPTRDWSDLPVSVCGFPAEEWIDSGLTQDQGTGSNTGRQLVGISSREKVTISPTIELSPTTETEDFKTGLTQPNNKSNREHSPPISRK